MSTLKKWIISISTSILLLSIIPIEVDANIQVSAQSSILIEQQSGRIIFEKDSNTKRRIASITKIMTAILAVESEKMEEIVTVSDRAVGTEGSTIYLKQGQKMKLEDLVYGLLLRSGNDAAVAIAEYVGGSVEGFVFLMNQKASGIGMTNTEFANPHGLDDSENHYSTAYDMALLTRYAMQNEKFKEIFGTKSYRVPNPDEKWDTVWKNKNRLLTGLYSYTTGGKTGFTKRAKRTLVSTATKDGLDLIAVTLNDPQDWNDHIFMYNSAFKLYEMTKIVEEGTLNGIEDPFYENNVFLERDFLYPLTNEEKKSVRLSISLLTPNKEEWKNLNNIPTIVGKISVNLENETIGELPVYFENGTVQKPKKSWWNLFRNLFTSIIGVTNG